MPVFSSRMAPQATLSSARDALNAPQAHFASLTTLLIFR
jgi:hypothetical protein